MEFYVYEHWRPDKGECFYVGKGTRRRSGQMKARNAHHLHIQNKLRSAGLSVDVRMISSGLSEGEAFILEAQRILHWKQVGHSLANHTSGGEGVSGFKLTAEQREKIGLAHRGKKRPQEWRERIGAALRGKPKSEQHCIRSKLGHAKFRGVPLSDGVKEKISLALKGRVFSEESNSLKREAMLRIHATTDRSEIHKKIGDSQRGVKRKQHSPETKAKMATSAKKWRAERRAKRASEELAP